MLYPVFFEENEIGTLELLSCGLYYSIRFSCQSPPAPYLYVKAGNAPQRLGLLLPEGDSWAFRKQLAQKELSQPEQLRFYLAPKEPGLTVCGIAAADGRIVTENGQTLLQIPFSAQTPFALISYARYFSIVPKNGGFCWQCNLDAQNVPVFVDNAAKCDKIAEVS